MEAKWQAKWEKDKIYSPNLDSAKKPFYNLMMFPYPSAEGMHVGNMYAFTGADVYGRFMRMKGNDVFEPIGLDGFGIHSENYAIKVGKHPAEQAKISEENFYRQLRSIGNSYDWTRTVETYKPEYYKWTQWLFVQLFKAGLAYKKKAPVNFCPKDLTVLADEQVIDGKCERCGAVIEKKELEQWFFKITDYSQRLLDNIPGLNWSEKVKVAQENWIGRSEGAIIAFRLQTAGYSKKTVDSRQLTVDVIEVFTTRPDTLFGATFIVLSPEHQIVSSLLKGEIEATRSHLARLREYVEGAKKKSDEERMIEEKEKTGVFSGIYAVNPVNQEKIPVWIADFVLSGYGTGAIMAVPAHDQRDFEFAKKFKLPIRRVVAPVSSNILNTKYKIQDTDLAEAYTEEGVIVSSNEWDGLETPKDMSKILDWLEKEGIGEKQVNYHLRDWLISRQRYWGPPIPMIYCKKCDWQPVSEKDLPVLLPEVEDWKPKGNGKSPLANIESFVNTKCPNCGGPAKRETDVSDTFLDSAWYFLRYACTDIESSAFDVERVKKWLPVNMYIGGAEHSVLHLLYSRFIAMVLADLPAGKAGLKFIDFEEPFTRFYAHGLIVKDGAKMSKSKGNVIVPDQYIAKFGADTLRCYLMFIGPFSAGGDFRDSGLEGMNRFLKRVWTLITSQEDLAEGSTDIYLEKLTDEITTEIENLRYNTSLSRLMMYYNFLIKKQAGKHPIYKSEIGNFVKMIAPFAPHLAEEAWELLGGKFSIHVQDWPKVNAEELKDKFGFAVAIQINGKTRAVMDMESLLPKEEVEERAKNMVGKNLEGKKILKMIYVTGKIVNFVTE